ncbi:MAG: DNA methylase [Butyrivibrio sp.]|nr:DNA methylase [Butyrivibrio sp.]
MNTDRKSAYIAIDLKSFYASVECRDLNRDPLTTNLVVADRSRTSKTICLAVSPSLKKLGIPGRARLFEVEQKIEEINRLRQKNAPGQVFSGESDDDIELSKDPSLKLSFIAAIPRMARYIEVSTMIYKIYLKYVAPEDIHVYSIDEVFIDATKYLSIYGKTPRQLAAQMMQDVWNLTGITATAGVGTNLYLCKVAMDIMAKHATPDENGLRIAELDELSYREKLWDHVPLTDFWRVGRGYTKKLASVGIYTMGDIARCSLGDERDFHNEELLYKAFGINAELLIDHAWGYEPCTMEHIKAYKPDNNSISQGQVLHCAYTADKARIVVAEMADALAMQLMDAGQVTDQIVLTVGYDRESLSNPDIKRKYRGKVNRDYYGREVPEHAHGSENIGEFTCLSKLITEATLKIYDEHVNTDLLVRRLGVAALHVISEAQAKELERESANFQQMSLFVDYKKEEEEKKLRKEKLEKEKALQEAALQIQKKFGKNAILKGISFEEGATGRDRNNQIGGHKA